MLAISTLTSKNQTTIPKAVIEVLGVKPADRLVFELTNGKIVLSAKKGRLMELAGMFRHFGKRQGKKAPTQEEMDAAIRHAAGESYLRSAGETRRKAKRRKKG